MKKIRDIRQSYKSDEINVLQLYAPRSGKRIHSPSRKSDHRSGGYVSSLPIDKVVWEVELDEKLHFLIGGSGSTEMLTKNVKCEIEEF